METSERRYYLDKLHDYANFQGIIRGLVMLYEEEVYSLAETVEKIKGAEEGLTKQLLQLEVKYAEKERA